MVQPGKSILWRPACSGTGEEQPEEGEQSGGEEGRGSGEGTPTGSAGLASSGAGPLGPSPMGLYLCPHSHLYTPKPRCSTAPKTLRDHGLARSPPQKVITGHLLFPFTLLLRPSSQLTSPAWASWAAWHRAHLSPWGGGRLPGPPKWTPNSRSSRSSFPAWFLLPDWDPRTHLGVSGDRAGNRLTLQCPDS